MTPDSASTGGISVLLVSQLRLHRESLSSALRDHADVLRVTAVQTCAAAQAALRPDAIDVLLVDLSGIDDAESARAMAAAAYPAPVVALAVADEDDEVLRWAECGAMAILTEDTSFDDLLGALVSAARGESRCSPRVTAVLLRRVAQLAVERRPTTLARPLTAREHEIAGLLVEGCTNKEIAMRLLLGHSTVKNHVHHVLAKVGARTRGEAIGCLVAAGIQSPAPRGTGTKAPSAW